MKVVKLISFLLCLLYSISTWASSMPSVDLYRSSQISADYISKHYQKELRAMGAILRSNESFTSYKNNLKLEALTKNLKVKIAKLGEFAYLNISPVFYPSDRSVHISIDVVDKKDSERLAYFLPNPSGSFSDPEGLLQTFAEYQTVENEILVKDKNFKLPKTCPAFHCFMGFEDQRLQKYAPIFNSLVPQNKDKLMAILKEDKNPKKRAIAVFLLAHIQDGEELIKAILPSIYDSDGAVRNNTMRVLAQAVTLVKPKNFPIQDILQAIDFPTEPDRNKALYVISALAAQPQYAAYIRQHAAQIILTQLKMLQPNLSGSAHVILIEISGKYYGQRDYAAWEKWLKANQA
jgi:hypothetical protein